MANFIFSPVFVEATPCGCPGEGAGTGACPYSRRINKGATHAPPLLDLHPADQFEYCPVRIFETHHADLRTARAIDLLERRNELHFFRFEFLVGLVNVVYREGNAADANVVQRRIRLTLRWWIDELDKVEHWRVGIAPQPHKYSAQLLCFYAKRIADAGVIHGEIVDFGEAEALIEADRPLHISDTNIDVKESLEHNRPSFGKLLVF